MTDYEKIMEAVKNLQDAFDEFLKRMAEALAPMFEAVAEKLKAFLDKIKEIVDEPEKATKFIPRSRHKKSDYLHNQKTSHYKADIRPRKNLPYQRRNY